MRHRASRPFADHAPVRTLAMIMVALSLGIGGYLAIASLKAGSAARQTESAVPTTSGDEERPLTAQDPETDGRSSGRNVPEPSTSSPARPQAPSTSDEAGSPPTTPGPGADPGETSSPSTGTAPRRAGDTTPPETSLSEAFPDADAGRFLFSANEAASFTCSLDGAAYSSCDSPTRYADLDPGWHTFAVRATDAAGNIDPSPAKTRWHANKGNATDR
jgi:hypothetical protein